VVEILGKGQVEENNGCGKQGGQAFERARGLGKRRRTAEESIRSTTESVRKTPINYDARNFTGEDKFLHRRREGIEGGGDKGKTEE